jgi:DNA-binding transcriptional ArsR family regulator
MTKPLNENLDRDQQILSRLARIEHKVDSLEQTTAFALRAESDKHFSSVKEIFGKSKRKAQVYLAVDGEKGVQEIAEHLKMKRQNVGPELKSLAYEGLLEIIDMQGGKDIWGKKPLDRTLRITKFLEKEFNLGSNGLPTEGKANRKRSSSK